MKSLSRTVCFFFGRNFTPKKFAAIRDEKSERNQQQQVIQDLMDKMMNDDSLREKFDAQSQKDLNKHNNNFDAAINKRMMTSTNKPDVSDIDPELLIEFQKNLQIHGINTNIDNFSSKFEEKLEQLQFMTPEEITKETEEMKLQDKIAQQIRLSKMKIKQEEMEKKQQEEIDQQQITGRKINQNKKKKV